MHKELVIALLFLTVTTFLTGVDVVADLGEGSSLQHILVEVAVVAAGSVGITLLVWRLRIHYQATLRRSTEEVAVLKKQAEKWQAEAKSILEGLAQQIDQQFSKWQFTPAEKEIALLLIKGLSLKEIATIRQVQEKTVRLQCTSLYKKSGVAGRAELAAFFLEDLLLPTP